MEHGARNTLLLLNRQRVRRVNVRLLRVVALSLLADLSGLEHFELGIHLVAAPEMATLNETFLGHPGSTDVITFNHSDSQTRLHGELFVCVDDAVKQAGQFRSTWEAEVVRYVVHGVLHLRGFDDLSAAARRVMKREENRVVRELAKRFTLGRLASGEAVSSKLKAQRKLQASSSKPGSRRA